jgi:hypothetical protein
MGEPAPLKRFTEAPFLSPDFGLVYAETAVLGESAMLKNPKSDQRTLVYRAGPDVTLTAHHCDDDNNI